MGWTALRVSGSRHPRRWEGNHAIHSAADGDVSDADGLCSANLVLTPSGLALYL